ncbi:MAG: hypothetical protein A2087_01235 [Spirochaetes bacterium GWD1_61_31]|nr:MAG: hypothetical protein A2Y37_14540 [Spirochaetes bacterium GWB1_60_80]OHD32570.1 MAG: hypothetical protein A2004_06105 [Spirochaetes bacterium GWC1_61_12]OHD39802.1 MAG: hypothetical protein A2087_01235 [Spirochaetes bacterium GWD1_61_31]OHD44563.1 MAG: hypothetical protein A2Y35_05380 [Spirochaetes bacterium GWE1_60_18]OHD58649.1 MAG: hypothetical protein A2Y32_03235 [Spirochaetes bacterium GWF1_60_12]HAP43220.1 hypothetical protein [Spirochaetaceae bacterium]
MATDRAVLENYMQAAGLKYTLRDDYIHTSFATDVYRNQDGGSALFMVVRLEEDGEYIKVLAPNLYNFPAAAPNAQTVFRVLLGICWRTKLIKFEYDEQDGEIRALVEFPLEDAALTQKQFLRCLNGLVQIVDEYHPAIQSAIEGGSGSLDEAEQFSDIMRRTERLYKAAGILRDHQAEVSSADLWLEE